MRIAAVGVPLYLILFFAIKGLGNSAGNGTEYRELLDKAARLQRELQPYKQKVADVKLLMEEYNLDPAKLSKAAVVGQASSAIQTAAAAGGLQLGPIHETSGLSSGRELASIRLEGTGPLPSILAFMKGMETLGYPLVIESVQLAPGGDQPGHMKLTLTIGILDFEQWKAEVPGA